MVSIICVFIKSAILVFKMAVIKIKKMLSLSSKSLLHVPILYVEDATVVKLKCVFSDKVIGKYGNRTVLGQRGSYSIYISTFVTSDYHPFQSFHQ